MKRTVLFVLLLLSWVARGQDTLYISTSQVVHLRFASELKYVNLGSRDIVAKIVDGSKDFVAVKAREAFDFCTSLSCLESNGQMHTFLVAYKENPVLLDVDTRRKMFTPEDYSAIQREIYHLGAHEYGIEVLCENVFIKDDILFLLISVQNHSAVSYSLKAPRFAIESMRKTKRRLQYEKAVQPKQSYGLGTIQPDSTGKLMFAFDKLSLIRGQVFRVYFYEEDGSRNLTFSLGMKDVNRARRLMHQ
ncbi:MAG: DUF4138 domain-containing protein [Bacteroidales bacterium]|nr:DUF4138 domain-containing protein [Bacteroidales bacterium]